MFNIKLPNSLTDKELAGSAAHKSLLVWRFNVDNFVLGVDGWAWDPKMKISMLKKKDADVLSSD